jgi:hypothetical protein
VEARTRNVYCHNCRGHNRELPVRLTPQEGKSKIISVDPPQIAAHTGPVSPTRRSLWVELALGAAAVTVTLGTILTKVRVPHAIADITLLHIGSFLGDTDKAWILLVWLCGAVAVVLCMVLDRRAGEHPFGPGARRLGACVVGVGIALTLILSVWKNREVQLPGRFDGLGFPAMALGLVLAVVVCALIVRGKLNPRVMLVISLVVMSLLAIAPLFQTANSFVAGGNNSFTFDELLAPANGRLSGFDFIAQYETLLGLPLAALAGVAPGWFASNPEGFAIGWLIVLQLATILLAVAAVLRVAPRNIRWLIPLTIVAIAYLAGPTGLDYYAVLPMRVILPTVLFATIVLFGWRSLARHPRWWMPGVLGFIGGIAAVNNPDFGAPAALAGLITVLMIARSWRRVIRAGATYIAGAILAPAIYLGLGSLTHGAYHLSYTLFFIQNFALNNFMNVDMPTFGLHDGFVLLGIVGVVIGALGTRRRTGRNAVLHQAMFFQGSLQLLTLVYFSGRSLTETLMTSEAFIAAVLLALLIAAGLPHLRVLYRVGVRSWRFPDWSAVVVIVLSLALPIAALQFFPLGMVPSTIARAISPPSGTIAYLRPNPAAALKAVPPGTRLMGVVTVAGTVWSMRLHVTNADVFLNPYYIALGDGAQVECQYLATLKGASVLITRADLDALGSSPTCKQVLNFGTSRVVASRSGSEKHSSDWMLIDRG